MNMKGVRRMRVRKAGKITDRFWYLGREESGVYCLEGADSAMLINGGLTFILPDVLRQMQSFGIDSGKIKKFLILHSHFDHTGIVPYIKRTWPAIEILASAPAWKIFAMPKAIEIMNAYSHMSAQMAGAGDALKAYDLDWRDDITGSVVAGGDVIDLGGIAVQIFDTPGHTNCSITAYEPVMKVLFPSDGGGIPFGNMCFPSMNTNTIQYLESLEKIKPLPVRYYCADHYGYITGDEAGGFIGLTLAEGRRWKTELENCYRKHGGDLDAAARAITDDFYRLNPGYFIAPDILEGVFKQMLKFTGKNLGN
jgi:glyoxylase-like metal-dependent hydrolase (beta-lactamase superfamily II)